MSNGSLYINQVHHTRNERPDEGIYQCVASIEDIGTIVSRPAKLQVASKFHFSRFVSSVKRNDTYFHKNAISKIK